MHLYQLKITLRHIQPPIWRRLLVPAGIPLDKLHRVLQVVMGWTDTHLHVFNVNGVAYGVPDPDFNTGMHNERKVRLDRIAGEGGRLFYEYDFGDGWEHDIRVEHLIEGDMSTRVPACLNGKRACPPEDCGGPPGYQALLEALNDPQHPEHAAMQSWLGDDFNPEAFDAQAVNQALRFLR